MRTPATTRPLLPLTQRSAAPHSCSRSTRLEVLGRVPLFAALSPEELQQTERLLSSRGHDAGDTIYRTGDAADRLFIVASGTVKLLRPSVQGRDVVTNILGPGESFGTFGISEETTYHDTAETLTVSCVLEMSTDLLRRVLQRHPGAALTALDETLHRLEQAQETIRRLSADSATQRVSAVLLALTDKFGDPRQDAISLGIPLTRVDLSSLTGLTPETVSRVMSRLSEDGIVATGRRRAAVLDRTRLAAAAAA